MRSFRRFLMLVPFVVAFALISAGLSGGPSSGPGTWGWDRASADTYTIQPGDTLWDIANRLQVGVSVLLALNEDITSPNNIYVGQNIQIPDNTAAAQTQSTASEPNSEPQSQSSLGGNGLADTGSPSGIGSEPATR